MIIIENDFNQDKAENLELIFKNDGDINWSYVSLATVLEPMTTKKPIKSEKYFRYIDIEAIDNKRQKIDAPKLILTKEAPSRASRELKKDDILFSTVRPYLKNIAVVTAEYEDCIGSTGFYVCRCKPQILPKYLFYLLCSEEATAYFNSKMKGDNSPSIRKEEFESLIIPLPTLDEQRQIANYLDELLTAINRVEDLLEECTEKINIRKSVILDMAIKGQLTKKWRREKNINGAYKSYIIKDLLKPMVTKKPNQEDENFRYIDIETIDNSQQVIHNPKIISTKKAPSRASREVKNGDVLFSMVRPYLKNIAYITEDLQDCIASTGFYVCRANEKIDSKYLYLLLCSDYVINYYTKLMKGDNSPSIRIGEFESLIVSLPSIEEQKKIVEIVEDLLEDESKIEDLIGIYDTIVSTKKSIIGNFYKGRYKLIKEFN